MVRLREWLLGATALAFAVPPALGQGIAPGARPVGGQVVAGGAAIAQTPAQTTVTQSTPRAAIDWQGFNVGRDHAVQFRQPDAASWTLNRVTGPDPSVIAGRMSANGGVAVVNQSGVVFAAGAQVNVGSLIASAAGITNQNFMGGRMVFDQPARPGARVENHGTVTVADRGLVALVGPRVHNGGTIRARLGRVALAGAEAYALDLAGDGLLSIDVTRAVQTAPGGGAALVTNSGTIEAAGGSVLLTAHAASGLVEDLVRHTGRIEALTRDGRPGQVALRAEGGGVRVEGRVAATGGAGERGGTIEALATGTVTIASGARVDASGGAGGGRVAVGVDAASAPGRPNRRADRTVVARGAVLRADATGHGEGGVVLVNSLTHTEMRGLLSARGGLAGGNGGLVEISGGRGFAIDGRVDVTAANGRRGSLLLDPERIVVRLPNTAVTPPDQRQNTPPAPATSATVSASGSAGTLFLTPNVVTDFAGSLTLLADRSIVFESSAGAMTKADGDLILRVSAAAGAGDGIRLENTSLTLSNGSLAVISESAPNVGAGTVALNAVVTTSGFIAIVGGDISNAGVLTAGGAPGIAFNSTGTVAVGAALNAPTDTVTFRSNGAITQGINVITAQTLRVEGFAGVGTAAGSTVTLQAPNIIANAGGQSVGDFALRSARPAGLTIDAALGSTGGSLDVRADGALRVAAAVSAANALTLSSGGLLRVQGGATVTVGTGRTITLQGDDIDLTGGGRIAAPGGVIALRTETVGRNAFLGDDQGAGPAGQYLNAAELALLGGSGATGDTVAADRLRVEAAGTTSLIGPVALRGRFGALQVEGGTGVTQTAAGILDVQRFVARPASGDVALSAAVNRIDEVAVGGAGGGAVNIASTDAATTTLTVVNDTDSGTNGIAGTAQPTAVTLTGNALQLAAPVNATAVTLNSGGAVAQAAAGTVTTGTLIVQGIAGPGSQAATVTLDAANAVGAFAAAATGAVTLRSGGALTVNAVAGSTVDIEIGGGDTLSLAGAVTAATGDARLSAGSIVAAATGSLTATGQTATLLADSIDLSAGPTPTVTAGTVVLGPRTAIDVTLGATAAGTLSILSATLDRIAATTLSIRAPGQTIAVGGNFAPRTPGIGTLDLRAAAVTQTASTVLDVARVTGTTTGALALGSAANTIDTLGTVSAGGALTIASAAASLAVDGAVTGVGTVAIAADRLTFGGGGSLDAATVRLTPASADRPVQVAGADPGAGTLFVNAVPLGATVTRLEIASTGTGALTVAGTFAVPAPATTLALSGATLAVNARLTAPNVELTARTGSITQAVAGAIVADQLRATAANAVALATATNPVNGNAIGSLAATAGAGGVAVFSRIPLTVFAGGGGVSATAGGIVLTAPTLTLNDVLSAPGQTILLRPGAGGVAQSADGVITASDLDVVATGGGTIALDTAANQIEGLTASTAGAVRVRSDAARLTVGAVSGNGVDLTGNAVTVVGAVAGGAGGTITVRANTLDIAAGGTLGVSGAGTVNLRPRAANAAATLGNSGAPAAFHLDLVELTRIATGGGRLRIGSDGAVATTGALGIDGDVDLTGRAAVLDLQAGSVAQAAGTVVRVGRVDGATGGDFRLDSLGNAFTAVGDVTAGGDVAITSAAGLLTVSGAVAAGAGRTLTLRADDVALTGTLATTGAGTINLLPLTLTRNVVLGGPFGGGALSLTAAELNRVSTGGGTLRIGANAERGAPGLLETTGVVVVTGAVRLRGGAGEGEATRLDLRGGIVAQSAAGAIDVSVLTGAATAGNFALPGTVSGNTLSHTIDQVGAAGVEGTNVSLGSNLALTVAGLVAAADNGTVGISTPAALTIATGAAVRAGVPGSGTGVVNLWGGSVAVDGAVRAGSLITLVAAGGSLGTVNAGGGIAAAGTVAAPEVVARSGSALTLALDAAVGTFRGRADDGALTVTAGGPLTLGGTGVVPTPAGGTLPVTFGTGNGPATITAPSLSVTAPIAVTNGTLTLNANGTTPTIATGATISVAGGDLVLNAIGPGAANGSVAIGASLLASTGSVAVTAGGLAGSIARTAGVIQATAANRSVTLTANTIDTGPGVSTVAVNPATGRIRLLPFTAGLPISLGAVVPNTFSIVGAGGLTGARLVLGTPTAGAITVAGDFNVGGATELELVSSASITQNAGTVLTAAAISAVAGTGAGDVVALGGANNIAGVVASETVPGVGVRAGGSVELGTTAPTFTVDANAPISAGTTITLRADGRLLLNADLTAATVNLLPRTLARPVTLGGADALVAGRLQIPSSALARIQTGASGLLRIGSDGLSTTAGAIDIAGAVRLRGVGFGSAGTLELRGASVGVGAGLIDVATLTGATAGTFDVGTGNAIDTLGPVTGDAITVGSSGPLTVAGPVAGTGAVALSSGGNLATTGTVAGSTVALSGPGDVTIGAAVTASSGGAALDAGGTLTVNAAIAAAGDSTLRGATAIALNAGVDVGALGTLNLRSDGAIAQSAGAITARLVDARGATGSLAGAVTLDQANAIQRLAVASGGAVTVRSTQLLTVTGLAAGANSTLTAAPGLFFEGAVALAGLRLDLRTDGTVGQLAAGTIAAGTLDIAGATGAPAGAVTLNAANAIDTLSAVAGSAEVRSTGALTVTGLSATGDSVLTGASIAFTGPASAGAGRLELRTPGTVTQTSGATLTAGALAIGGLAAGSASGAVTLTEANAVGSLTANAASVAFTTTTALTVAGLTAAANSTLTAASLSFAGPATVGAARLDLRTPGTVTQAAGATLTAGTLDLRGIAAGTGTGAIVLSEANAVGTLLANSTGGIAFANAPALTVASLTAGGDSAVTAGALSLAGPIDVGGAALNLRSDGAIAQSAGTITAGAVAASGATGVAASSIALGAANAIGSFAGNAAGNVTVRSLGPLTLAQLAAGAGATVQGDAGLTVAGPVAVAGGPLALRSDGTIVQTGGGIAAATVQAFGATGALAGPIALTQPNAVGTVLLRSSGGVAFASTQALTVVGLVANGDSALTGAGLTFSGASTVGANTLALRSDGPITQSGPLFASAVTLAGSTGAAAGAVTLADPGNAIAQLSGASSGAVAVVTAGPLTLAGLSAGGDVALTTAGTLTLAGPLAAAGRAVTLSSGEGIAQDPGAPISAVSLRATAAGGIALPAANAVATIATLTAGGPIVFRGGSYAVTGPVNGSAVALSADGDLLLAPGVAVTGGTVGLSVAGSLTVGGTVSGAELRAEAGGATTVALGGSLAGTSSVRVAAGGALTIAGTVAAPSVTLDGGGFTLAGGTVFGGDIVIVSAGGAFVQGGSLEAGGTLGLRANGAVTLVGARLSAEVARVSGATLDLGGSANIGTAILFRAPGGIGANGRLFVTPRSPARRPAVVLDTRLGNPADPLLVVRPDVPGTPAAQQPTQVRDVPSGQGPGVFGPATADAAGAIAIDIAAPDSPVILLANGAPITGTIDASRLLIQGAGGSANLTGRLGGQEGLGAAQFSDITRPAEPGRVGQYRINGCVVASINCVVPPAIQVLPQRPAERINFTIENSRLDPNEVVVPNVAETDYE